VLNTFILHEVFDRDVEWDAADASVIAGLEIIGTRLTYEDGARQQYEVKFMGPDHKQRAEAYCTLLTSSGARVGAFLPEESVV